MVVVVMFDDFISSQPIVYSLLKNSIMVNKLSHAYLIDANNNEEAYDFVMSFAKMIVCQYHYTNLEHEECKKCGICHRIDNSNYPEIKVIETDSLVIKKEQLLELQSEFSKISIEGNYRVYIIKDCEKMNKQAANSLLKFLEEPVDGVVAILLTNHFSKLLSTIVSRCQVIRLISYANFCKESTLKNFAVLSCDNKEDIRVFLEDDSREELLSVVLSFVDYYEENGLDVLLYMKKLWYNKIQSREDAISAFLLMLYFYYDVLKYKVGLDNYVFCSNLDVISRVASMNSIGQIVNKLEIVNYGYEMLFANLNVNLLLDDVMIRLGDSDEYS